MLLSQQTINKLVSLINEETKYRTGSMLVDFFNQFGFNDVYGQGFPSRAYYTAEKLKKLNGSPDIDKCIRLVFAPIEFVAQLSKLDSCIADFNQYLVFDGWIVVRNNTEISFRRETNIDLDSKIASEVNDNEDEFLKRHYSIDLSSLSLSGNLEFILESRITEISNGLTHKMPLSVIILAGSSLEGILLDLASKTPKAFNQAVSAPKDSQSGNPRRFHEWTLANFIDVAFELGYIKEDVKKFSHALRDFRNYIHPYEQMSRCFNPSINTAQLCVQALKAAIVQISEAVNKMV